MYSSETLTAIKNALSGHRSKGLIPPSYRKRIPVDRELIPFPVTERERLELAAAQGVGTLPERIIRKWFEKAGLPVFEQQIVYGGHLRIGGGVVDFIVNIGTPPGIAIRVQGDYWHKMPDRVAKDWVQYERLVAKGYRVVDLWEGDIYEAVLGGFLDSYMKENLFGG